MNTMTTPASLPADFRDLERFVERWARPTENERNALRWSANKNDFAELYEAVMPKLDAILERLSRIGTDQLEGEDANLFNLAAAFAEASPHHELYGGSPAVPHSFATERFRPLHGDVPSLRVDG